LQGAGCCSVLQCVAVCMLEALDMTHTHILEAHNTHTRHTHMNEPDLTCVKHQEVMEICTGHIKNMMEL